MKYITLLLLTLSLSVSADKELIDEGQTENLNELGFMLKSYELVDVMTKPNIPTFSAEDVVVKTYLDENGILTTRYSLTGESKEIIGLGSFAANKSDNDNGTDCDGSWSCGIAIKSCLDNGKEGSITPGQCSSGNGGIGDDNGTSTGLGNEGFCVKCFDL